MECDFCRSVVFGDDLLVFLWKVRILVDVLGCDPLFYLQRMFVFNSEMGVS